MKPRHPAPLNALRAFEAAARCLSFQDAAAQLFVTPAAVSHQATLQLSISSAGAEPKAR